MRLNQAALPHLARAERGRRAALPIVRQIGALGSRRLGSRSRPACEVAASKLRWLSQARSASWRVIARPSCRPPCWQGRIKPAGATPLAGQMGNAWKRSLY